MFKNTVSRRRFLGSSAAAATFHLVPRHVLGQGQTPPSEKLNLAFIGAGGRAGANLDGLGNQNVIALCDVHTPHAANAFKKFPDARQYVDFRKMLDELDKSIDAVVVSTPDHTHAVAAIAAMNRKKHVYCEKPLAHSIGEVRAMMKAARDNKVITQMGNQGHSFDAIRVFCEWIWDGAVGNVHTIHVGCSAPNSAMDRLEAAKEPQPIPEGLDWDLWLGPAQFRPYNSAYLPGKWRSWSAFGCGTIGDWVCHVADPVFWALDLGAPTSVQATAENYDPKLHGETFPRRSIVKFQFPAKGKRGPITMHFHSGFPSLPRPEGIEPERKIVDTGGIVIGDKGGIMYGSHGANGVRIFPESKMKEYKRPEPTLPRVRNHYADFMDAVKNNRPAGSDFSYGGPLTELALLGIIGMKFPGQELKWNSATQQFTNVKEANAFVNPPLRTGWTL